MEAGLEIRWLYTQYKKGLGVPNCWDVTVLEDIIYATKKEYPVFVYNTSVHDIKEFNSFAVVESRTRCVWFNRNNVGKYIEVCHLGKGRKVEVDENRLIEIRAEIMGIINHIDNKDYGMAMLRVELIREKINKLI